MLRSPDRPAKSQWMVPLHPKIGHFCIRILIGVSLVGAVRLESHHPVSGATRHPFERRQSNVRSSSSGRLRLNLLREPSLRSVMVRLVHRLLYHRPNRRVGAALRGRRFRDPNRMGWRVATQSIRFRSSWTIQRAEPSSLGHVPVG